MPSQADKNNDILKKILEIVEQQRKEILILKQDIQYIKKKIPERPPKGRTAEGVDTPSEPEKISTGWLW